MIIYHELMKNIIDSKIKIELTAVNMVDYGI